MSPLRITGTEIVIEGSEVKIEGRTYVIGLSREDRAEERLRSHLYRGRFDDPGPPMCAKGWNRDGGESYSIWRGQIGTDVCRVCVRRALAKAEPVQPPETPERPR